MIADFTRREALGLAKGVALGAMFAQLPHANAAGERITCFIGQSGFPRSGAMCLGMLATARPEAQLHAIAELRLQTKHRRTLQAGSTDKYAAAFCKAFVDHMLADKEMRFFASLVRIGKPPATPAERDAVMLACHVKTLEEAEARGVAEIYLLQRDEMHTGALTAAIRKNAMPSARVGHRKLKDNDLIQLAGFIAAAIRTEGGKVRRDFRAFLKQRLGVRELNQASLARHPNFRIREIVV